MKVDVRLTVYVLGGIRGNDGGCQVKGLVAETTLEHWFFSYIELLQRLQLFTKANEVGLDSQPI